MTISNSLRILVSRPLIAQLHDTINSPESTTTNSFVSILHGSCDRRLRSACILCCKFSLLDLQETTGESGELLGRAVHLVSMDSLFQTHDYMYTWCFSIRHLSCCYGIVATDRPGNPRYERRICHCAEASRTSLEREVCSSPSLYSEINDLSASSEHNSSNTAQKQVVLKCAPDNRLQREKEILQQFKADSCIRNLIDHGEEPPVLVLEHLESDALQSSKEAKFSRQDIKFVARSVLSALKSLHAEGIAHTGISIRL